MITRRGTLAALAALTASTGPQDARAQTAREHHILMILFRGWEEACDGFRDYFQSRNMPVRFTTFDLGQDVRKAAEAVELARNIKPDLVFVWGTSTALAVLGPWDKPDPRRHLLEFPSVFCIVTDPVGNRIVKSNGDPGRNATGVEYVAPLPAQLRAMTLYRPFRKIGVVFNPREQNSVSTVQGLQALAPDMGFELTSHPVRAMPNGELRADEFQIRVEEVKAASADWLFIPPDTLLNVNRDKLTGAARDLGLPTFSAAERFIRDSHALCGLVSRYWSVGAFAGFKAEQILVGGRAAGELPVELLARLSFLVRRDTAHRLALAPPINVMKIAELV
jgi:putative ABC transport system substrate-binding protein